MAIELPTRVSKETTARLAVATTTFSVPPTPTLETAGSRPWPRVAIRALEIAPGAVALFLISSLFWGYVWFPHQLATALLVFDVYWLWKSWTIGYHVVKGVRIMRDFQSRDWRK